MKKKNETVQEIRKNFVISQIKEKNCSFPVA